jgi:Ninjurin
VEDRKPEIVNGHRPTPERGIIIPSGYFPQWPTSYPTGPDNMPSLNLFQQKKTIAQGMLDLALLSANANQLRYILEYKERNHYYYVSLTLISLSLVLQVLVAIALVFKSRYNIDNEQEYLNADRINNFITMGILFITIINVFTSAFGVMPPQT